MSLNVNATHQFVVIPKTAPGSGSAPLSNANLDMNSIPNGPSNFSDPNGAAPNFNGNATVDTASLNVFGNWVSNELMAPLQALKPQLQSVQVEPGAFYWADHIRSMVNGTSSTTGLKNQFGSAIEDLLDGLSGISSGVKQLAQKYANTEDMNKADAANLESDMSNSFGMASGYFNILENESQAGGGAGGGGGGGGAGSSGGGGGGSGGSGGSGGA